MVPACSKIRIALAKVVLLVWLGFALAFQCIASPQIDSLKNIVHQTKNDTVRLNALMELSDQYINFNPDSAKLLLDASYALLTSLHFYKKFPRYYHLLAEYYIKKGDYSQTQKLLVRAAKMADSLGLLQELFAARDMQATVLSRMGNYQKAIKLSKTLFPLLKKINTPKNQIKFFEVSSYIHINSG